MSTLIDSKSFGMYFWIFVCIGMSILTIKKHCSEEQRCEEAKRICSKYPDRIPV